jgi:hypothetical protein
MASKTFAPPEQRQPRSVGTDPAFRAGAAAFPEPPAAAPAQPEVQPVAPPATPEPNAAAQPVADAGGTGTGAVGADQRGGTQTITGQTGRAGGGRETVTPPPTLAFAPAVLPESKMTIYPGVTERARLATIKAHHRLAESIVAEYALEELFRQRTDDDIAAVLRGRGHSLRRARPGQGH